MVFGIISAEGPVALVKVKGIINSAAYENLLFETLLPWLDTPFRRDEFVFQQDNAPIHTSGLMKRFFEREGIAVLPWPTKSPDLNLIENVWGLMKRYVSARTPKTLEQLDELLTESWNLCCTQEMCRSLYVTYENRISAVIDALGARTKY